MTGMLVDGWCLDTARDRELFAVLTTLAREDAVDGWWIPTAMRHDLVGLGLAAPTDEDDRRWWRITPRGVKALNTRAQIEGNPA